ncbi:hypothetical protein B0G62_12454 [Paraburkholderia eburnea]|uniref:Uncharacterized protein n=1 Tax=Paraburkholderia eburnea TaxID=1189126 RepID=A0A2S4LVH7_9BURK|nr:hypothetical protein B0G62_12454 [Paraburkholderia eburnea]PRZ20820.1 hypothetical protein BX588_11054 [Paraburkholderia eburnea]
MREYLQRHPRIHRDAVQPEFGLRVYQHPSDYDM